VSQSIHDQIQSMLRPSDDHRWFEKLQAIGTETILPVLIEIVSDDQGPAMIRGRAVIALGHLQDIRATAALAGALAADDAVLRAWAAQALGRVGEIAPDAQEGLIARLGDADAYVRRSSAEALGQLGATAALPHLQAMAAQDDQEMNRAVATDIIEKLERMA
jgi:HEAT repeat protein